MTGDQDRPMVLGDILARHAATQGDKACAVFDDGSSWTYADALTEARQVAGALARLGVAKGERVFVWLPNGKAFLRAWLGTSLLGAIMVPCNLAWRGRMLDHALALCGARVAIVHCDLVERLADQPLHALEHLIVAGGLSEFDLPLSVWPEALLEAEAGQLPEAELQPWDSMCLFFTSGTTGPSKGVLSSYRHAAAFLAPPDPAAMDGNARFLLVLPLFHAGGLVSAYTLLWAGGTLIVPGSFSTERFWSLVRDHAVTSTTLVEQMASFLLSRPAADADAVNPLAHVNIAPMGPTAYAFAGRFAARLWTSYGSTEIGAPITARAEPDRPGITGRLRQGYAVRLVDAHDIEVSHGTVGELVIRADQPWTMLSGYVGAAPDASEWRNGWLHTGDLFRRDDDGWFSFVDRLKDAIRRRGENISSFEVEAEVLRFSGVREVAAYAVPDSASEDELMVALAAGDSPIDWTAMVEFLRANAPHYMVPRYFRQLQALPRNESGKVRKAELRAEGITADTWDREVAGIRIKAGKVGGP